MNIRSCTLPHHPPDAFLDLPHSVYREDPDWIPEDRDEVQRSFAASHDWFRSGQGAAFYIPDRARLAVFRPSTLSIDGRPAAFFGYWEQRGDGDHTLNLLAEAETWAAEHGAQALYGPVDFNTSRRYRLRAAAEAGALSFIGEPYNPQHYCGVLERAGFHVVRRYVSQIGVQRPLRVEHKERIRDQVLTAGYRIEALDGPTWRSNLADIKQLTDAVFAENFGFAPESLATFSAGYAEAVARRLCPRTSLLARDQDGTIIGFALLYPQYGPLVVQRAGTARVAAVDVSFAQHAPVLESMGMRTAVVRTVGVHPAHRARGVMDAMIAEAVLRGLRYYDKWIGALIEESNCSRRFGAAQTTHERAYVLYGKELAHA